MKKLIPIILFLFLPDSTNLFAQITYNSYVNSIVNQVNTDSVYKYIRQLSGDTSCFVEGSSYTITTRHYSKQGNIKAAAYILERFQSFGLNAWYQNITSTLVNVLAKKTGTRYPNQYVIFCAHFDDMPNSNTAPGADDNASGTAAVIEAARLLSNVNLPYTIVFAAWDEEERGLYGSKAYADTAFRKGDSIIAVLNFDMIAYDSDNNGMLDINTNTASTPLANDYFQIVSIYQPMLLPQITTSLNGGSDHQSFQQKGYKAILAIEDNNDFTPFYHTLNDSYASLNKPYCLKMIRAGIAGVVTIAGDFRSIVRLNLLAAIEGMWNGTVHVKDTVRVYLRNSTSPYGIADSAVHYLSASGTDTGFFQNAVNGNYFIQLNHRNSLETWSASAVSFSKGAMSNYSFTSSQSQAYGNNTVLKSGRFCLYSGDVNKDGLIEGSDASLTDNSAFNFASGYLPEDIDGDNIVDASDLAIIENNALDFKAVIRP